MVIVGRGYPQNIYAVKPDVALKVGNPDSMEMIENGKTVSLYSLYTPFS
ncbi:hypothetical protein [Bartonella sp. WD16.2]|nr:hypothetical protein [Bartonella sp. WD16.2]